MAPEQHWLNQAASEIADEIRTIREKGKAKNVLKFGEERLRSRDVAKRFRDADETQKRGIIESIGIDKALELAQQNARETNGRG